MRDEGGRKRDEVDRRWEKGGGREEGGERQQF